MRRPRILVITPVAHIPGVLDILESVGAVTLLDDPSPAEVRERARHYDAIFTNPNKSKVFLGADVLAGANVKVICTASTGTNHIDQTWARARGICVLSLTEERQVIDRISSTAELAFGLMLASLRHIVRGHAAVMNGEWDYTQYIGRQMDGLTVGVVGYGRLGSMFARYSQAFGSRVLVFDPYKRIGADGAEQVDSLPALARAADVISLHVHVTAETTRMLNDALFSLMKDDVVIVNTSRGEIVDEHHAVSFLATHPRARYATDVLTAEQTAREQSPLLAFAAGNAQVIITPHIGGMTMEAQAIAYGHAAQRLHSFFAQG